MINFCSTGDTKTDVRTLLHSVSKEKIFAHSQEVASMCVKIAQQYGLDEKICELCGYLHDISAVILPPDMMKYAVENGWYVDEAEKKFPFLLHQRISRVIAEEDLELQTSVFCLRLSITRR